MAKRQPTEQELALFDLWVVASNLDDANGFDAFYELVFSEPAPKHAIEEWIKPLYQAREEGKGVVIEAFRGSTT